MLENLRTFGVTVIAPSDEPVAAKDWAPRVFDYLYSRELYAQMMEKRITPQNIVSYHVIENALKPHSEAILKSPPYQRYLNREVNYFAGQGPHEADKSCIHSALWGYSDRTGVLGRFAGIIYRITEWVNEFLFGASDKIRALDEIRSLLNQEEKLNQKKYKEAADEPLSGLFGEKPPSQVINEESERIFNDMILSYNIKVLAARTRV